MMHSDDTWDADLDWPSDAPADAVPPQTTAPPPSRGPGTRAPESAAAPHSSEELMCNGARLEPVPRDKVRTAQIVRVGWTRNGDRFVVAEERELGEPGSTLLYKAGSRQAASLRILSHRLKQAGNPQAVLITSARPQEGRTTCALNLARAFAEDTSAQVMLIEANCSRPSLHTILGGPPPECLTAQLVAHHLDPDLPWQVISAIAPNLHVLAMSPAPETPALNAAMFGDLILALREERYSHIVVDSPPVLGSGEVNALAEHCDAILFAARAGISNTLDLENAASQLSTRKLLGVVLLDV